MAEQGSHKGCPYRFDIAMETPTLRRIQTEKPKTSYCRILRHLLSLSCDDGIQV